MAKGRLRFWSMNGQEIVDQGSEHRPAVFQAALCFLLGPPPPGGSGESPDCYVPQEFEGFGPVPARIRGVIYFLCLGWP